MERTGDAIEKRKRAIARRLTIRQGTVLEIDHLIKKQKVQSKKRKPKNEEFQEFESTGSPRAMYRNRKLVAGGDGAKSHGNIMFDSRVCRGSNYTIYADPPMDGEGESAAAKAAEARRLYIARLKKKVLRASSCAMRLKSPPPIPGHRHEPPPSCICVEEMENDPPGVDPNMQRDLHLARPVSPLYVPAHIVADVGTYICPCELWDYDMEVQPILEVLVGRTVEQALIEVISEDELTALKLQKDRYNQVRATDTAEAQRLEEREKRIQAEKIRRFADFEDGLRIQKEMEDRIAACLLVQGYVGDMLPRVLEGLEEKGFLIENIKQDVDDIFMPWLMKEVTGELQEICSTRDLLLEIVKEVIDNCAEQYKALYAVHEEEPEEGAEPDIDQPLLEHLKLKKEILDNYINYKECNAPQSPII